MKVKIINNSPYPLPAYETIGSAGMDLRANIIENIDLLPMQRQLIPTGIFIELPDGFEAQVRPRSGFAYKAGVTVLNTPGTIDSDYRGELKVLLVNLSDKATTIEPGQRIAQMIISKYEKVEWQNTEALADSARGSGGYGHTGK
ncbi:MAG: dUTP diphosphatase [Bacteroidetes bacterium]|nr:dUTP diphosphatase [Bacteroidota bacterium]